MDLRHYPNLSPARGGGTLIVSESRVNGDECRDRSTNSNQLSLHIKAIPYGIYDLAANEGFVNVGQDHDTAEFAVASLKRWWKQVGRATYPNAKYLMITADSGGPNDGFEMRNLMESVIACGDVKEGAAEMVDTCELSRANGGASLDGRRTLAYEPQRLIHQNFSCALAETCAAHIGVALETVVVLFR